MSTNIFYYEVPHFGRKSPRLLYGEKPTGKGVEGRRTEIMNVHELTPEQVELPLRSLFEIFNRGPDIEPAPATISPPSGTDDGGAEIEIEDAEVTDVV